MFGRCVGIWGGGGGGVSLGGGGGAICGLEGNEGRDFAATVATFSDFYCW